jgi:hypothetical protein
VRLLHAMVPLNGKIYVIGGISNGTYEFTFTLPDVEAFDVAAGTWQRQASLPEAIYVAGVVTLHGKIYVLGGVNRQQVNGARRDRTSNRVFCYDPATDAWTEKAGMQRPRSWFDAVALGGKIYAVGGNNGNTSQPENSIEEYDVASDAWTDRGAFTNGLDGQCQAIALQGRVCTLSADAAATIGEFDPATATWTARGRLAVPIMDFGKAVFAGRLYIIGGHPVANMGNSSRVLRYDPATNGQDTLPAIGQWMNATVALGGVVYAIGGIDSATNYVSQVVRLDQRTGPVIARQPLSQTVTPGQSTTLEVAASGRGPLGYRWLRNGQPLTGTTTASLALSRVTGEHAGDYAVVIDDDNGSTTSWPARVVVAAPEAGRLVNLSVRTASRGRNAPVILGFAVSGGTKPLLIRGIGPALAIFGVGGVLPDPVLEVHATVNGRDTITASSDQWGSGDVAALRTAFASCGAFGLADAASGDAALVHAVDGTRSAFVYDAADRSGVALVELYDIGTDNRARLTNLSARNLVGAGDAILIAGFSLSGNTPRRVLIRGIGPQLATFGVPGTLADPMLEVYMTTTWGGSVLVGRSDNWGEVDAPAARAAFAASGAFGLADDTSSDAAIVLTLPPGVFTAQLSGVGATTGEALVEVYELP